MRPLTGRGSILPNICGGDDWAKVTVLPEKMAILVKKKKKRRQSYNVLYIVLLQKP